MYFLSRKHCLSVVVLVVFIILNESLLLQGFSATMVEISFSLIRKQNPDMNLDNLEEVKSVNLNDCMIDRINNLELFSHIQQLHINQNNLSRIENISFMTNLNHIDISYNLIEAEGLMSSLKEIPPSLRSIDLTGNPCAINEDCLGKLLDAYPELNIIIDIIPVQDIEKNTVEIAQKDSEEVSNSLHENLKADELLKSIVDRKCRLQSYATFNVDSVVQVSLSPNILISIAKYINDIETLCRS